MNTINVPHRLAKTIHLHDGGKDWLERLPDVVRSLSTNWNVTLGEPIEIEASCSWVAPCTRADGSGAILKVGWPHMEAADEAPGLHCWNGDPTVYILEEARMHNAMLLERCEPGTSLRILPETRQDEIIAKLMRRLWRSPSKGFTFRPLAEMIRCWMERASKRAMRREDPLLVQEGLEVYESLLDTTTEHVLLATDLHAGNVLRAQRKPWLVIDPKPFVGDPNYDATQHLLNSWDRLNREPFDTIQHFAHLLELDARRIQLWLFARTASLECGDLDEAIDLARRLAP